MMRDLQQQPAAALLAIGADIGAAGRQHPEPAAECRRSAAGCADVDDDLGRLSRR